MEQQILWLVGWNTDTQIKTSDGVFSTLDAAKQRAEAMANDLAGDSVRVAWEFVEYGYHGAWRGEFSFTPFSSRMTWYVFVAAHILDEQQASVNHGLIRG